MWKIRFQDSGKEFNVVSEDLTKVKNPENLVFLHKKDGEFFAVSKEAINKALSLHNIDVMNNLHTLEKEYENTMSRLQKALNEYGEQDKRVKTLQKMVEDLSVQIENQENEKDRLQMEILDWKFKNDQLRGQNIQQIEELKNKAEKEQKDQAFQILLQKSLRYVDRNNDLRDRNKIANFTQMFLNEKIDKDELIEPLKVREVFDKVIERSGQQQQDYVQLVKENPNIGRDYVLQLLNDNKDEIINSIKKKKLDEMKEH